jgi:L-alanine-DL-glutamate epimerase-like enolase superfamily enzyme
MKLCARIHALEARRAFQIARIRTVPYTNVFVRVTDPDGVSGYGEASPNPFYGETPESVLEKIQSAAPLLVGLKLRSVRDLETTWQALWDRVAPSRAAQCALDLALWDWLARRENATVPQITFRVPARPVRSFATLGLSSAEELPSKLEELAEFEFLKIKSDHRRGTAPGLAARERFPNAQIALDANCSWSEASIEKWAPDLTRIQALFLEQPFPPGLPLPQLPSELLLMADESVVVEEDLNRLPTGFGGFNVKLVKCGGLTPALRMLARGRERGLRTMVGCMLESSCLIAAGAAAAQNADHADLDGAWLLSNDPFSGWKMQQGCLHPPNDTGLGAQPEPHFFPGS